MAFLENRGPLRSQNGPTMVSQKVAGGTFWPHNKPVDGTLNYYWSTISNPNPYKTSATTENIYIQKPSVQQKYSNTLQQGQRRQVQPFPLQLPNSTPTMQPRGLPRQSSPAGVYQNVPRPRPHGQLSRDTFPQPPYGPKAVVSTRDTLENGYAGGRPNGMNSSNGAPTLNRQQQRQSNDSVATNGRLIRTEPVVNGNGKNNGNGLPHRSNGSPSSALKQPLIWSTSTDQTITQIRQATPPRFTPEKARLNQSRKPRWGRLMQSFCCCMAPQQDIEPVKVAGGPPMGSSISLHAAQPQPQPTPPPLDPGRLITQVNKDGTTTTAPPEPQQTVLKDDGKLLTNGSAALNGYNQNELQSIIEPARPQEKLLLPPLRNQDLGKKCLIIDLDETLVHSSFKPVSNPDFVIPVEIDGVVHQVYVLKRPFVDEFLAHVGSKYECVLFTASLAKYAHPVADLLDKRGVFRARLFREACVFHKGNYVKDLARLGRDLNKVLIMDNSPASYAFHPENAIAVQTWFDDPHDVELLDLLPLLDKLAEVDSVYSVLRQSESPEPNDRSHS